MLRLCVKIFVESSIPLEKIWILKINCGFIHALIGFQTSSLSEKLKRSITTTLERENVVIWNNKIDMCVTHDGLRECVISSTEPVTWYKTQET